MKSLSSTDVTERSQALTTTQSLPLCPNMSSCPAPFLRPAPSLVPAPSLCPTPSEPLTKSASAFCEAVVFRPILFPSPRCPSSFRVVNVRGNVRRLRVLSKTSFPCARKLRSCLKKRQPSASRVNNKMSLAVVTTRANFGASSVSSASSSLSVLASPRFRDSCRLFARPQDSVSGFEHARPVTNEHKQSVDYEHVTRSLGNLAITPGRGTPETNSNEHRMARAGSAMQQPSVSTFRSSDDTNYNAVREVCSEGISRNGSIEARSLNSHDGIGRNSIGHSNSATNGIVCQGIGHHGTDDSDIDHNGIGHFGTGHSYTDHNGIGNESSSHCSIGHNGNVHNGTLQGYINNGIDLHGIGHQSIDHNDDTNNNANERSAQVSKSNPESHRSRHVMELRSGRRHASCSESSGRGLVNAGGGFCSQEVILASSGPGFSSLPADDNRNNVGSSEVGQDHRHCYNVAANSDSVRNSSVINGRCHGYNVAANSDSLGNSDVSIGRCNSYVVAANSDSIDDVANFDVIQGRRHGYSHADSAGVTEGLTHSDRSSGSAQPLDNKNPGDLVATSDNNAIVSNTGGCQGSNVNSFASSRDEPVFAARENSTSPLRQTQTWVFNNRNSIERQSSEGSVKNDSRATVEQSANATNNSAMDPGPNATSFPSPKRGQFPDAYSESLILVSPSRQVASSPSPVRKDGDSLYQCPVLNCAMTFSDHRGLRRHVTQMYHSPCNPFSTIVDGVVPEILGFLCPACGHIFKVKTKRRKGCLA